MFKKIFRFLNVFFFSSFSTIFDASNAFFDDDINDDFVVV